MKSFISANSTISSKRSVTSRLVRPSMMPLMKTFSRPEISGWKPAPSSISAEMRPSTLTVPSDGLVMPATSLSSVLLPDPLRPMTPSVRPFGTVNADVVQRREGLVGLQVAGSGCATAARSSASRTACAGCSAGRSSRRGRLRWRTRAGGGSRRRAARLAVAAFRSANSDAQSSAIYTSSANESRRRSNTQ